MKKNSFSLIVAVGLLTSASSSKADLVLVSAPTGDPIPSSVPSKGLVGYLPLDGNTVDVVNSNNSGVIVGTVYPTTDRFGRPNSAYSFTGTNVSPPDFYPHPLTSQVVASNSAIFTQVTNSFSISFWFKANLGNNLGDETTWNTYGKQGYTQSFVIFGQHVTFGQREETNTSGIFIAAGTNGVSVVEGASSYFPVVLSYTNNNLGTNWNHAVVTCHNNSAPVLYINGKRAKRGLNTGRKKIASLYSYGRKVYGPNNISEPQNVGGIGGGIYGAFNGSLDQVALYNRALKPKEVASMFSNSIIGIEGAIYYDAVGKHFWGYTGDSGWKQLDN